MLSLRIINLDGTVVEKDITLDIQPFNYCIYGIGTIFEYYLDYYLVNDDQILVTYHDATNPNDFSTYVEWGMVIDYNGNVISQMPFGPAFFFNQTFITSTIEFNINKQKGFLRYSGITNSSNTLWQQFQVDSKGQITQLTNGTLNFPVTAHNLQFITLGTIDGNYAVLFANSTSANNYNASAPLQLLGQVSILHILYNQTEQKTSPLILYQTPIPNITFTSIFSDISYDGVGQICTVAASQTSPTGTSTFYIMINFLSSGSVASFQVFNDILPVVSSNPVWVVNSLRFGGFLLTNTGSYNISGYLYDESGNFHPWEFNEPQSTNVAGLYGTLPNNNTFFLAQPEVGNSWQLLVIDLPKFAESRDNGYSNLNVQSTVPAINATINPSISSITINFYNPVAASDGALSIYQMVNGQQYLRQSIPNTLCTIGNGGQTISASVLSSTFSSSKGDYFITMDNNFVVDASYHEPLLGIESNIWTFTTPQRTDDFATSTTGLLRLNTTGSQYFDSLSSDQHSQFFNKMLDEIAISVPVSRSRLTSNQRTQTDTSAGAGANQYLISVGILETRDLSELSSASVINTLNTLVRNKAQTPIAMGQSTSYLDESYGFVPSPDLWEKYKTRLLGVFLIIGLLIVLFLFAQRRDNSGNNIAILQLGLIIFDLVMDVLFVCSNARDVPVLYAPSIVFLTVPIGVNTILAFIIITKENTIPKFLDWFTTHGKVASVFTVLAGANIEALNVLHSNLAGFPFFRAPFTEEAKTRIFWGACLNIFIEDIPQVIIQVIYRYETVSYDIIPLLTLVSSALNLTINIIGRLYQATNRLRHGRSLAFNDNNDDDFGDLGSGNRNLRGLESGENPSREVSTATSQSYLGDLDLGSDEKLGGSVNTSSGNDTNQNKGMTFLKRITNRKDRM